MKPSRIAARGIRPVEPTYTAPDMRHGSFKLFRAFGIDVFMHWSWWVMAVLVVPRIPYFEGPDALLWKSLLFVTLFVIVILHEFGHALACRSVGGESRDIVLWPLGGIAYVKPPARPGAVLWSIAAGPLVNVLLIPVTVVAYLAVGGWSLGGNPLAGNDLQLYCFTIMGMNFMLLIFNMMPIYPLDGGQVLMSLLWFVVGRPTALKIASVIGLVAAGLLGVVALLLGDIWLLLITGFVALQAFNGFRLATAMPYMDPRKVDERQAQRDADQSLEARLRAEVDPWR